MGITNKIPYPCTGFNMVILTGDSDRLKFDLRFDSKIYVYDDLPTLDSDDDLRVGTPFLGLSYR